MTTSVQEGTLLLGKYRVEKELGRGAMGYVVAARHEHLGELFAVKLMLPEALERPDAAARFLREARACARLKSEHVVRVTDSGANDDGVPVMVMEYLVGEDLQSILDERKVFPMHEAVSYLLQACDAVAEAHELGIVHRDLKPSNLFLTRRPNGKPCVKVLDFGISKDINPSGDKVSKLTATGSILGTPYYMSPEQMRAKPTDARGDIWSLGVILYEFVTGRLPFPGENYAEVAGRVLYEKPRVPSHYRKSLPPLVDEIVMRCLEIDPDKRFPNVREFVAALDSLMALPPPPDVSPNSGASEESEKNTVIQVSGKKSDEGEMSTLVDGENKETIRRPESVKEARKSASPGNSQTLESATPIPTAVEAAPKASAESTEEAPVFYAKRVFGHQTKKTWASNSRAGRSNRVGLILFAVLLFGLAGAGWYYKDTIAATIKSFTSKENPDTAPSATSAPSSTALIAPETSASVAPSASTAPRVVPKTGLSNTKTKAATSASAARSANAPPSAAPPPASAPSPPPPPPAPPPAPSAKAVPTK